MVQQFYAPNIKSRGQAFLVTVILALFGMLILITLASTIALRQARISEIDFRSKRSYFLSESGIEDAIYRAKRGRNLPSSYNISLFGASTVITVTNVAGGKEIQSAADVLNTHRILKSSVKQGTTGVSFSYALQVGQGGLVMENSSRVIGSVYSNGSISGKNTSSITEDAFAAGLSEIDGANSFTIQGNARAHLIRDAAINKSATSTSAIINSSIGVNAYADSISSSSIGKDAYYNTSLTSTTVGGQTFPNTPPPADLPVLSFPISDAQISAWESSAEAGGIISSPCPYILTDGTITLGSKKINCDFSVENDAVVIVTGPIWVAGNFTVKNTAQVRLDSSYGSLSEVIIAHNPSNRTTSSKIIIDNTAQVLGSGSTGSYIGLISQNNSAENGGSEIAIQPKNSADASIYYAPHGLIEINNSSSLKEATAYKLLIKNSATVTYESGLASSQFNGPAGGLEITSWLEVP